MGGWREIPGNSGVFAALTKLVGSAEAIAYVGAGASAPLYPLWGELIRLLADAAVTAAKATERERELWCRRASSDPLATAHRIRSRLGPGRYAELIHETFKPRPGADGKPYTAVHAALLRLPFGAYVTTNYDIALTEARADFRPGAHPPPFTWRSDNVSRWIQGQLFRDGAVPVLHAHGLYSERDSLVLTSDEYRRAYRDGPYPRLFEKLWSEGRLVVVGFGFSDPWIGFLADQAITRSAERDVTAPGHVAVIGLPVEGAAGADVSGRCREDRP